MLDQVGQFGGNFGQTSVLYSQKTAKMNMMLSRVYYTEHHIQTANVSDYLIGLESWVRVDRE